MIWMFLLGMSTGMRAMTPMAVVCWFAWLGLFPVHGTWAFWAGNIISVVVFTLLAAGEYVGDTLPTAPNRTAPGPAAARLLFGGVMGAIIATAYVLPVAGGVLFGVAGATAGTWGGFRARRYLSARLGHDLPVALLESALALGISVVAAHHWAEAIARHPAVYV